MTRIQRDDGMIDLCERQTPDPTLSAAPGLMHPETVSSEGPGPASPVSDARGTDEEAADRTRIETATKIGHYIVLDVLGVGGMGVVVAAYDPKLDRKVAIKLLHGLVHGDPTRRVRMEREARAMARLSHPNVVTIYEVGEHEGHLFLAMEFVKGRDLRVWLSERGRSLPWRAVLAVFLQAGQGLAAAHAVGIVHRDFKPANVFVGDDGRVRVGDFGLAREMATEDGEAAVTQPREQVASVLGWQVTATGATLGTPTYMAPEQFERKATDARTDQFAFCVALWEALYGQRPYRGETFMALLLSVTTGQRAPPPAGRSVPAWLRRVLERGMSQEPGVRWPSTDALLAALRADPTRRRRILAGVAAIAVAAAGGVGGQRYRDTRQVAACEAEGASIAEVWNSDAERRLRDGLRATGASYAEATAERVLPRLSRQAEAWRDGRTEACLRARVHGTWDEDALARSAWCFEERRMELAAFAAEFSQASAASAQRAIMSAAKLSQVGPCLDAGRLARLPPPPEDRASATAVQALLLQAGAKEAAGEYDEGLAVAEDALASAEALAWPPLVAAAWWRRGGLLTYFGESRDAEAALNEAYFRGTEAGEWELAASAAHILIYIVGIGQSRVDEGRRWWRHGEAALAQLGADAPGLLRAHLLTALALVHRQAGEYAEATTIGERALAMSEQLLGPEHPDITLALFNLAHIHQSTGNYTKAQAVSERALALLERTLGPDHPDLAGPLNSLGNAYRARGQYAEARAMHERALDIREKALDPDDPQLAGSLSLLGSIHHDTGRYEEARAMQMRALDIHEKASNPDHLDRVSALTKLGNVHWATGRYEEARASYARALEILEAALGPDHPEAAPTLQGLALVHAATGEYEKARVMHERALEVRERALGPDHPAVASSLWRLATVHQDTGEYAEARALAERALAIRERALGAEHPDVALTLTTLAEVASSQHRPMDAVALAQRAVGVLAAREVPAEDLAQARFVLAQALESSLEGGGRDHTRVEALARQALDGFRAAEGQDRRSAEVVAFLKAHGGEQ